MSEQDNPQTGPRPETTGELVTRDVAVILGRHGLILADGTTDRGALGDRLEPVVTGALVDTPGERTERIVWANPLTADVFGADVVAPALWVEQDDYDRAAGVFKRLRGEIVRVLSTRPDGEMQARLARNGGLVLVDVQRTPRDNSGAERGWYVTRHPKCITEDLRNPARQKALNAMNAYAALTEMSIERVPEHAGHFDRDYKAGQRLITEGPASRVRGAIEAASNGDGGDVAGDGDE